MTTNKYNKPMNLRPPNQVRSKCSSSLLHFFSSNFAAAVQNAASKRTKQAEPDTLPASEPMLTKINGSWRLPLWPDLVDLGLRCWQVGSQVGSIQTNCHCAGFRNSPTSRFTTCYTTNWITGRLAYSGSHLCLKHVGIHAHIWQSESIWRILWFSRNRCVTS